MNPSLANQYFSEANRVKQYVSDLDLISRQIS